MATEILSGALGELRAASTAGGGTALTTTATYIQLPLNSYHLFITPRNFSTAVVAKIAINPWLVVLKTVDAMVTAPTDYSSAAQDADASTDVVLSSLSTLANGDFLLIGSHLPFRGCYLDVDSVNSNASVLTVYYWNGTTWADITATDGTISPAGTTLGQDGLVNWTVPTAWVPAKLSAIYTSTPASPYTNNPLLWTRWVVNAALDAATTLNSLVAANRSTAYAELLSGQCLEERVKMGIEGVGCIEALTDAGTANLIVNTASVRDGRLG